MKDRSPFLEPRWIVVFNLLNDCTYLAFVLGCYKNRTLLLRKKEGRIKRPGWGVLLSRRHSLFSYKIKI